MEASNRYIRVDAVAKKLSVGNSTVWYYINKKNFPKPYKLSANVTVWSEREIDMWLESRREKL